jgi:phosphonate transport system permease protein
MNLYRPPTLPKLTTIAVLCSLLLLIIASFCTLSIEWRALFTSAAAQSAVEFLHGFSPPDVTSPFLSKVANGALETLAMSAIGTLLALVFGMVLALVASGRFGTAARLLTRFLLNGLRAVPELVWAVILLVAAGLGPFTGTLALAVHTTGVLGRLFADTLENLPPAAEATLRTNGAKPLTAFCYAALPQALPQMMSYTLYRWENNIRAAAILGVVGAGGLGQMLKYHISLFQMQQAATVIIAMLLMIVAVDGISFWLRRRIVG